MQTSYYLLKYWICGTRDKMNKLCMFLDDYQTWYTVNWIIRIVNTNLVCYKYSLIYIKCQMFLNHSVEFHLFK